MFWARGNWSSRCRILAVSVASLRVFLFRKKSGPALILIPKRSRAQQMGVYEAFLGGPGDSTPKPGGACKTILSTAILEPIPDLLPVRKAAHRLLAPGGRFSIATQMDRLEHSTAPARLLRWLGQNAVKERYARIQKPCRRHHHAHSPQEWRSTFAEAGRDVVEERLYASPDFSIVSDALITFALPALAARKPLAAGCFFQGSARSIRVRSLP